MIDFLSSHVLSIILLSPVVGAVLVLLLPANRLRTIRWTAFLVSLVPLAFSILAWRAYAPGVEGYQFVEKAEWYAAIGSSYHLGVDGISLSMVLLTTLLTPLALLISWSIEERVRGYMALFLLLETGMLGVFLSLDLLMFFVFWEVGLVPMYFLINQWGSANRNYASFKFLIYTMAGSLGLLLAIQLIGLASGTFDLVEITQKWTALNEPLTVLGLPLAVPIGTVKAVAFWAFVLAFAIKVPVWPFHTWLPDAHTEAPTAGSMILAGVLLNLGAYGFLRFVLPLYPEQAQAYAWILGLLAVLAIVLGAFSSWAQDDFKRLVAYSSVNHMGFVVLGVAAAAQARGTLATPDAVIAVNGAVLQMFNHGLSAAGMFLLVGVIYERTHTRDLNAYGGLFPLAPVYGGILLFTAMASLGLPGLNGFVSEFMVVRGAWPIFTLYTAVGMIGLLITGAYILKGLGKVLHGPMNEKWVGHKLEIGRREILAMAPLMVLMLVIGVWPSWILGVINATVMRLFG
ncbi:MAG TPA: NADH-quinone oxidoreductase subunit M [Anaerolineales bacterium]|nr:NADH-quinone oxidoreductase subunit M [Anaerolineales bacterium]